MYSMLQKKVCGGLAKCSGPFALPCNVTPPFFARAYPRPLLRVGIGFVHPDPCFVGVAPIFDPTYDSTALDLLSSVVELSIARTMVGWQES